MKKGLIWYSLWLKLYVRKIVSWLQVIGMATLVWLVSCISIPDSSNVTAGIVCGEDGYGKEITASLLENDEIFLFRQYDNTEELYRDVISGRLECGFVIENNLDRKLREGDLEEIITYIATPLATKGETIQEVVYAEVLRVYSDEILKASEKTIYEDTDEARTQKLLERSRYYQNSDMVFRLEIASLDLNIPQNENAENKVQPVKGMVGTIIFLVMFLAYGKKFDANGYKVEKAMGRGERFWYGCMHHLAAGTLPAVCGLLLIVALSPYPGLQGFGKEIIMLILFLILCSVWIEIVGGWMNSGTTFVAGSVTLVIANLLICPVLINWETYIPAMRYLCWIFPLGIYLYV